MRKLLFLGMANVSNSACTVQVVPVSYIPTIGAGNVLMRLETPLTND